MKICIIGNSHVGSLKRAWELICNQHTDLELTFFAARANGLEEFTHSEGALVPTDAVTLESIRYTSGGHESLVIDDYDVFLTYALGASPYYKNSSFYSQAVTGQSIRDLYEGRLFLKIIQELRKSTNKKILVAHTPLPSHDVQEERANNTQAIASYVEGIAAVNTAFFEPINCELLAQPLATLSSCARHTQYLYAKGSKRLDISNTHSDESHDVLDLQHMNDVFGRLYLEGFFNSHLDKASDQENIAA